VKNFAEIPNNREFISRFISPRSGPIILYYFRFILPPIYLPRTCLRNIYNSNKRARLHTRKMAWYAGI